MRVNKARKVSGTHPTWFRDIDDQTSKLEFAGSEDNHRHEDGEELDSNERKRKAVHAEPAAYPDLAIVSIDPSLQNTLTEMSTPTVLPLTATISHHLESSLSDDSVVSADDMAKLSTDLEALAAAAGAAQQRHQATEAPSNYQVLHPSAQISHVPAPPTDHQAPDPESVRILTTQWLNGKELEEMGELLSIFLNMKILLIEHTICTQAS
jgi:hypothetical protein